MLVIDDMGIIMIYICWDVGELEIINVIDLV